MAVPWRPFTHERMAAMAHVAWTRILAPDSEAAWISFAPLTGWRGPTDSNRVSTPTERLAQETLRVDRLRALARLKKSCPRSIPAPPCLGHRTAKLDERAQHIRRGVLVRGRVRMSGVGPDFNASHPRLARDAPEPLSHRARRV